MVIGTNGTLAIGYNCSTLPDVVSGLQYGTLDFTQLGATADSSGMISGPTIDGVDVQHGRTVTNHGQTCQCTAYNSQVLVSPSVGSATNHTHGGLALLDWTNSTMVNVGLARAGEGLERQLFGPAFVGQGELKKLIGLGYVRDYDELASKTLPGSLLDGDQTLGTEAIIREGIDQAVNHVLSMEWRKRYDGQVGGEPGSEILETEILQSDILRLTGLDIAGGAGDQRRLTEVFVLQMSYVDVNDQPDKPHGLLYLDLGDDRAIGVAGTAADRWLDAPLGNFAGEAQPLANTSWDEFRANNPGELKDLLGYWGWSGDGQGAGVAWAVLDYNHAQFSVPEPGTLALLTILAMLLAWRRWSRKCR